jgi:4-amino-4-deoxy-L-arabinose transferase-like glycosyltransferase
MEGKLKVTSTDRLNGSVQPNLLSRFPLVFILTLCCLVLFLNLGGPRLWDRDEPRNAGCAAEMLERGDWVVPIFNDQLRHQKPALLYWLMMVSYSIFGQTEFGARFGSALLGTGTVLLTFAMGSMLYSRTVGIWSAVILCTTLMFGVASRAATPDATLIFFMTAGLTIFVAANREAFRCSGQRAVVFPQTLGWSLLFFLALALAVLAKGLAGFVVPMAVIGLFLLLERLPRCQTPGKTVGLLQGLFRLPLIRIWHPGHFWRTFVSMRPLLGVLVVLLVAGPWYVWVGMRTDGEFLRRFFLDEHLGRATRSFENHSGGWWFYPVAIMIGFFPWSILTLPVGLELNRDRQEGLPRGTVFLLGWVAVIVALFSLVATKLPSYVTPTYPAIAVLVGVAVDRFARGVPKGNAVWFRWAFVALGLVAVPIAAGLAYAANRYVGGRWELGLLAVPLLFGGVLGWQLSRRNPRDAAILLGGTAVVFMTLLWGWGTVVVDSTRGANQVWRRVRELPAGTPVATYRCLESSWVVYGGHPLYELSPEGDSAAVSLDRKHHWMPLPRMSPEAFAIRNANAVIVTTEEHLPELLDRLPKGYEIAATETYFLRDKRLVLLQRSDHGVRAAERASPDNRGFNRNFSKSR